jgi:hypothetical protein
VPWMFVRRRRRYGGVRRRRFGGGFRRRYSSFRRRGYGRFARSGYRRPSFHRAGRGRYRGRAYRGSREVRLVIQTPSDMLPPRPVAGQFARLRRRARF